MENTSYTFQPDNSSSSPSVLSLCPSATTLYLLPCLYTLLFITALPGNAVSLWVFLRSIPTLSPTHIYLTNLSFSNLLLSLAAPFLAAYYALGSARMQNGLLCQLVLHVVTPLMQSNIYIGLLILTLVALSRFAALVMNTHASQPSVCMKMLPAGFFTCLTKTSFAGRVCGVVWVLAVTAIVPVTVNYSVNEATGSREAGDEKGKVEVCYSPLVELGGRLSAWFTVPVIILFFVCYLLVLISYMTVLTHITRSRSNTHLNTSQCMLGRALRKIVVIQVVLSVCLLPYHIFKPIFISLAHNQNTSSPLDPDSCHPLSTLVEVKNVLLLLAAFRGSTDPFMYFILDKTFRYETLKLLTCKTDRTRHQTHVFKLQS